MDRWAIAIPGNPAHDVPRLSAVPRERLAVSGWQLSSLYTNAVSGGAFLDPGRNEVFPRKYSPGSIPGLIRGTS
jgi:hypothetical protein